MDSRLTVHKRIHKRHPELEEEDVLFAWEASIMSTSRVFKNPNEYLSIGFDNKGRLLEMVAVRMNTGDWIIYHATTPPSDKTYRELGITRS